MCDGCCVHPSPQLMHHTYVDKLNVRIRTVYYGINIESYILFIAKTKQRDGNCPIDLNYMSVL